MEIASNLSLPVIESANKDQLKVLFFDNKLYFQIKAPVYATATAAYLKDQVDAQQDWRNINTMLFASNLTPEYASSSSNGIRVY